MVFRICLVNSIEGILRKYSRNQNKGGWGSFQPKSVSSKVLTVRASPVLGWVGYFRAPKQLVCTWRHVFQHLVPCPTPLIIKLCNYGNNSIGNCYIHKMTRCCTGARSPQIGEYGLHQSHKGGGEKETKNKGGVLNLGGGNPLHTMKL